MVDQTPQWRQNLNPFCLPPAGNYYSLRSQHEKAALYFQRALKLNPRCLGAWTLMGHEYMEMRNTSAAIQAYRSAPRCCRVCLWHTSNPHGIYRDFCLFVFVNWIQTRYWSEQAWLPSLVRPGSDLRDPQDAFLLFVLLPKGSPAQVQQRKSEVTIFSIIIIQLFGSSFYMLQYMSVYFFRPNDSRMLVALGESYEKLAQQVEAKKVRRNLCTYLYGCLAYCARVCVFWPALCLCSVTGGPTQWGTWRKWLCSNLQSKWLC